MSLVVTQSRGLLDDARDFQELSIQRQFAQMRMKALEDQLQMSALARDKFQFELQSFAAKQAMDQEMHRLTAESKELANRGLRMSQALDEQFSAREREEQLATKKADRERGEASTDFVKAQERNLGLMQRQQELSFIQSIGDYAGGIASPQGDIAAAIVEARRFAEEQGVNLTPAVQSVLTQQILAQVQMKRQAIEELNEQRLVKAWDIAKTALESGPEIARAFMEQFPDNLASQLIREALNRGYQPSLRPEQLEHQRYLRDRMKNLVEAIQLRERSTDPKIQKQVEGMKKELGELQQEYNSVQPRDSAERSDRSSQLTLEQARKMYAEFKRQAEAAGASKIATFEEFLKALGPRVQGN